jgi:hypothetical protein
MADAHVVGDNIEDKAEVELFERAGEALESGVSPEFGVDAIVVAEVVAMGAARTREKDRGGVEMADAEVGEVGGEGCGVVESEAVMELESVGGAGEEGGVGHGRDEVGDERWERGSGIRCCGRHCLRRRVDAEAEVIAEDGEEAQPVLGGGVAGLGGFEVSRADVEEHFVVSVLRFPEV